MKFVTSILCSLGFTFLLAQQSHVRTPALSPDGSRISFTFQGDIWSASSNGGIARRLTIHPSYESHPQWSTDGSKIVFQGFRWNNNDIYVMNASGGKPKRLTYHSTSDTYPQWSNDGSITFSTRRAYQQLERENEMYSVPMDGGTPQRYLDALGNNHVVSPAGNLVAFEKNSCRISREAYTGPANRDIWIYNTNTKQYHEISSDDHQDIYPNWAGNDLFFLSARNGKYNIFKQAINLDGTANGAPMSITNFTDEGITHFDISLDGNIIVFERKGRIYKTIAKATSEATELEFKLVEDDRYDEVEHMIITNRVSTFALSPNEKNMALSINGDIFIKKVDKEKKRTVKLTNHPFRDKEPQWINDNTLIFSSDRGGNFDLYVLNSIDREKDLYKSLKTKVRQLTHTPAEEEAMNISPDRKKIAFRRGRGKLIVANISPLGNLSNEVTLVDGWDIVSDLAWSPDSRWVAYSSRDLHFNTEIYIQPAIGGKATNVSFHPRPDRGPVWSKDGSKLGFRSTRNNGDTDIWFVWLKKEDWEKTQRDWEDEEKIEDEKGEKDKEKKKTKSTPVQIDFEDIHQRIQQVSRMAGNEENLVISKDGETFYFTTNGGGRQGAPGDPQLMSAKWDGSEIKTILKDGNLDNLKLDKKGKNIYALAQRRVPTKIILSKNKQEKLPFQAKMDVVQKEERTQVFNEGWRRLRDGFYDPEFHGQNWDELKERYRDRCINASTDQDFQAYFNEMLGQLNASHMGLRGGVRDNVQIDKTGILGIESKVVNEGILVNIVIPNSPATRKESTLHKGDIITAVNGQSITATTNLHELLNNTINNLTLLSVKSNGGGLREVRIRPTESIRTALYEAWVKERKRLTESFSNGKLGYIHIRGMNWTSFERFERELTASGLGKEGIVIDVRYNGGGWTTDMLMTVLNVRQHSFTIPRGAAKSLEAEKEKFLGSYPFGERLPFSAVTVPSIALCNETSYSNAEIFAHAFKGLGLGTLVGMPTFGAVISTGSSRLMDGSSVRMPFRGWYVKGSQMNMEHGPAVPDIIVSEDPGSKGKGEDPQLKKAVEVLLQQIGTRN
ncbi:MAG: S41 family peptidase [Saprospiraceae bacterium]